MDVEGEASWCAMEAADEIKEGGTEVMPTREIGSDRTTPKDPEKPEKGLPS